VFHISILAAWRFGGAKSTKAPRGDGTGRGHSSFVPTFMFMSNSMLYCGGH